MIFQVEKFGVTILQVGKFRGDNSLRDPSILANSYLLVISLFDVNLSQLPLH